MRRTLRKIAKAKPGEAERILDAIIRRYNVLYPEWDLNVFSVERCADPDEQADRIIAMFERFKSISKNPSAEETAPKP